MGLTARSVSGASYRPERVGAGLQLEHQSQRGLNVAELVEVQLTHVITESGGVDGRGLLDQNASAVASDFDQRPKARRPR